jgi:AcrR family transcriptional regulator
MHSADLSPVAVTASPTRKGAATRAFLLRTAAEVFARRGYSATTMNDLITASGLAKGAFYFHFRSKAELALSVLDEEQSRIAERVRDRMSLLDSAAGQLRALVPTMLELLTSEPRAWSLYRLSRELHTDDAVDDRACRAMTHWVGVVTDIVARAQADGDVRADLDPAALATVIVGAFDGIKSLTDTLAPGAPPELFAERIRAFAAVLDLGLVRS